MCYALIFTGCDGSNKLDNDVPITEDNDGNNDQDSKNNQDNDDGSTDSDLNSGESTMNPDENKETIADYFPFFSDYEAIYEGEGNEYAAYRSYIDFVDQGEKRIQIRTNNGGTESVKVIENKDGVLSVIYQKDECYYRDNFINQKNIDGNKEPEILLMEPLVKGTEWTLTDGRKRFISGNEMNVETPLGTFQALEVTTTSEDSVLKDYYVKDIGLVKSIFESNGLYVTSSLSEQNKNVPFVQSVQFYYFNKEKELVTEQKNISFHTNDITRQAMKDAMLTVVKDTYLPYFTANTKINSMYLGQDNIVYVDFSKEFFDSIDKYSEYETYILQSIANTLGGYYGAKEVYLTIDQKPYSSKTLQLKKGETLKVKINE
jgi:hypothetical protein